MILLRYLRESWLPLLFAYNTTQIHVHITVIAIFVSDNLYLFFIVSLAFQCLYDWIHRHYVQAKYEPPNHYHNHNRNSSNHLRRCSRISSTDASAYSKSCFLFLDQSVRDEQLYNFFLCQMDECPVFVTHTWQYIQVRQHCRSCRFWR